MLLLLVLIIRLKLHAFVALVLVSLLVAIATRIPVGDIVSTLTSGFGMTLANVALLVGLGAMLGRLLEFSGGAQVLADSLVRRFGENRAPLALGVAALLFGLPIFFDAAFVVFLPIVFTVARRLGGSILLYGLPVAGAFAVMHAFVPPHPGPVAAAELIGADIGLVVVFGLLIGIPTWIVGGYLFGTWARPPLQHSGPGRVRRRGGRHSGARTDHLGWCPPGRRPRVGRRAARRAGLDGRRHLPRHRRVERWPPGRGGGRAADRAAVRSRRSSASCCSRWC